MFGITQAHLKGGLARRLFTVLVTTALLPVALASILVYGQFRSLADERKAEQLLDTAKTSGMSAIAELNIASIVLESRASHLHEYDSSAGRAQSLHGNMADTLFSSVESILLPDLAEKLQSKGLSPLSKPQEKHLQSGKTLLLWTFSPGIPASFYLLRLDPTADHAAIGTLNSDAIWSPDSTLLRATTVTVSDSSRRVLYGFADGATRTDASSLIAHTPPISMRPRVLEKWEHDGTTWQGVSWDLFLLGNFGSESLRIAIFEPVTSIANEIGTLQSLFPAVIALALILGLWIAVIQIRRYLDPLLRLTEGTRLLAARRFDEPIRIDTGDELAELGQAFNDMAGSIQSQLAALETMSEIDRLLLTTPGLEKVLGSLLPRIVEVTQCVAVSVLIIDPDATDHARSYDLLAGSATARPVRRVEFSESSLSAIPYGVQIRTVDMPAHVDLKFLEPVHASGCASIELWPLQHRDTLLGFLCLGHARATENAKSYGHDFADRLTVALMNFRHEERLYRQANFDPVTDLANRHFLREKLAAALDAGASHAVTGALLYIDLDDFKHVNDSAGHSTGDELLQVVGKRLLACVREGGTVARLGGDEFVLLTPGACDADAALTMADQAIEIISQEIAVSGGKYFVSASIGIAMLFSDGSTVEELLRNGDIAMYRAKEMGRGKAVFFTVDMHDRMQNRASMEAGIRRALADREFEVHYQPIHDHVGLVGAEALIRWRDPSGELLNPGLFIPVAEEAGLIVEVGAYVIRTVCQHWSTWQSQGCAPRYIAVNVSPRQLHSQGFAEQFLQILRDHGVPNSALQIEITESVFAEGPEALAALHKLADAGISIALDDFGTGYSSLSYLSTFPIDVVKIDRSFVVSLPDNGTSCRLVETIIGMAHSLEKKVVAEGVETPAQRKFLLKHHCDRLQGYLLGRPAGVLEFNALLVDRADSKERRKVRA